MGLCVHNIKLFETSNEMFVGHSSFLEIFGKPQLVFYLFLLNKNIKVQILFFVSKNLKNRQVMYFYSIYIFSFVSTLQNLIPIIILLVNVTFGYYYE